MSVGLPARGEAVRWNGGTWRTEPLDGGVVELRNVVSGERETLTAPEWFGGVDAKLIERRVRPPGLVGRRPRKGSFIRWKNATWRITVVRGGIMNLQDADTDESGAISLKDFQEGCFQGRIEMVGGPGEEIDERTRQVLSVPIASMSPAMREKGDRIAFFFDAWRNPDAFYARHFPDVPEAERRIPRHRSKRCVEPFLALVAKVHGEERPGFSTFCKWMVKVDRAGGDTRAAIFRHDLQGPHARRLNARVEQWLCEAIDTFWLTDRRNKKKKVHEKLVEVVEEWNSDNPGRHLDYPSQEYVTRYIRDEVDRYVVARRRGTKEEADRLFKQTGQGIRTTHVMERVEMDHTLVQLRVKDDRTGVILGYPWITAALDHYSRMPLSIHLNFESQSLGADLQSLRQVMSPKGFLKKLVPDIDYIYPAGVPFGFFFDRGADYDSVTVRRVGMSLDIPIDYGPGACPEYKGALERWWRTLKEDVVYGLPGAKRASQRDMAGVDDDGEAYITYSELVRRLWLWASMVYAKTYHRGIDDIPLNRWLKSADATTPRALRRKDDLNVLLTHVVKCVVTREGVTHKGLTWIGKPLEGIMRHPGFRKGMEVEVRFDEYDVSQAWVIDPFTRRDEPLAAKLKSYMEGLSFHAHDRILKNIARRRQGKVRESTLVATKAKLREQEGELMRRAAGQRSGSVSSAVTKFAGIGQKAPSGDDLASVMAAGEDPFAAGPGEVAADQDHDEAPVPPPKPAGAPQRLRNDD